MQDHWINDGQLQFGVGIENTFVPQERVGDRALDEYELTQHYSHWREDLKLASEAGATFVRWGLPWYLVEPRPGEFDWQWIDEVAHYMQELGLKCVVDLMHYGTPLWLENEFLNAKYPERVASYARAVAERYVGIWEDFTPLNEPVINAIWCGEIGKWPPYLKGQDGFVKVLMAVSRGMVRSQQEIAATNPRARFFHVDAGFRWEGEGGAPSRQILEERRFLGLDLIMGRVDDGHPLRQYLRENGVTDLELSWFAENRVAPDVVGVNYYPAFSTTALSTDGEPSRFEAGALGLRDLLELYWARYRIPLAVTETSRGGSVESRIQWLKDSVAEVRTLRGEGIPILAYTWFPFFTLVNCIYREYTEPADYWFVHMGLVDLERGPDKQLRRRPTQVFEEYRRQSVRPEANAGTP